MKNDFMDILDNVRTILTINRKNMLTYLTIKHVNCTVLTISVKLSWQKSGVLGIERHHTLSMERIMS